MKVLIVNAMDTEGGAARAAYRLHTALVNKGVNSQMLVQSKASDDFRVIGPQTNWQKLQARLRPFIDNIPVKKYKNRTPSFFSINWFGFSSVVEQINAINPDVVHLHWVNYGMIKIEDLVKIKAPIVWTMHDNWLFTGGCHVMWDCKKYINSCGACPLLGSSKSEDLSYKVLKTKQKTFSKLDQVIVVGLSTWLVNCAQKSSLLKNHSLKCLPNPIDTEVFAPLGKAQARKLFNLPANKKLVLFGAISATKDENKGFNFLISALSLINTDVELVVFGSSKPKEDQGFKQNIHYLGRLHDDVSIKALYSAADVMVIPSIQEAFGQTATESMACGTPVVAFGATGLKDIVDHKISGYLAKPYESQDLAKGIEWVLNNASYPELAKNARKKIVEEFDSKKVAVRYIELYKSTLSTKPDNVKNDKSVDNSKSAYL